MKNNIYFLFTCFLIPVSLQAAPRTRIKESQHCTSCSITRSIPTLETQKPLSERERDHALFAGFINIIMSFAKICIDPHNIPEAKQNANNILTSINHLANVITRRPLTPEMQKELSFYIANYLHHDDQDLL